MGNEMGNNNTSGFKEEETVRAEAPEKSLLNCGQDDEVEAAEVKLGSDDPVKKMVANDKEEAKKEGNNPAELQVHSERSTDRNKDDNEVETKSEENERMESNLKENRLDTEWYKHEKEAVNEKETEEEEGEGFNLNTTELASDDPKLEKILQFECIRPELLETKAELMVEDSENTPGLSLDHSDIHQVKDDFIDSERTINMNGGVETEQDMESGERRQDSNMNTAMVAADDPKSEKFFDVESIQKHETPETEAGFETVMDSEKKEDELIELNSAAENVDFEDEETVTDLIIHNSSDSQPEEHMMIESLKSIIQLLEVEESRVLMEETKLKEPSGIGIIVHDNIQIQFSDISNHPEFTVAVSNLETNAEETVIIPDSVVKNSLQNETSADVGEGSDGENVEIPAQRTDLLILSVRDGENKNKKMAEATDIFTNNGHEAAERRESEENLQETSTTLAETDLSTKLIDEQNAKTFPSSTDGDEDRESPGRTNNDSNSDKLIGHIEMRKSPSFNLDIPSEGRAEDSEKTPLLSHIKTVEDLRNLEEISFPNVMDKRVVTIGKSASEKSRSSIGFEKEKEEIKALDQDNSAADKKADENLPPTPATRKGKHRSKSLIFGNCICCTTAIN